MTTGKNDNRALEDRIAELEARIEIQNLAMNYEWAVDHVWDEGVAELFGSIFAEDAVYYIEGWGAAASNREEIMGLFHNRIKPSQDKPFSHIGGVVIDIIDQNTATGRDSFYHVGYNAGECSENPLHPNYNAQGCGRTFDDLDITMGWHKYEFSRIDGVWQITRMEVYPIHTIATY